MLGELLAYSPRKVKTFNSLGEYVGSGLTEKCDLLGLDQGRGTRQFIVHCMCVCERERERERIVSLEGRIYSNNAIISELVLTSHSFVPLY